MSTDTEHSTEHQSWFRKAYPKILLLLPFIVLLWVPFYNDVKPTLLGFPFFYWYQLLWVPATSLIIFLAYKAGE